MNEINIIPEKCKRLLRSMNRVQSTLKIIATGQNIFEIVFYV